MEIKEKIEKVIEIKGLADELAGAERVQPLYESRRYYFPQKMIEIYCGLPKVTSITVKKVVGLSKRGRPRYEKVSEEFYTDRQLDDLS